MKIRKHWRKTNLIRVTTYFAAIQQCEKNSYETNTHQYIVVFFTVISSTLNATVDGSLNASSNRECCHSRMPLAFAWLWFLIFDLTKRILKSQHCCSPTIAASHLEHVGALSFFCRMFHWMFKGRRRGLAWEANYLSPSGLVVLLLNVQNLQEKLANKTF